MSENQNGQTPNTIIQTVIQKGDMTVDLVSAPFDSNGCKTGSIHAQWTGSPDSGAFFCGVSQFGGRYLQVRWNHTTKTFGLWVSDFESDYVGRTSFWVDGSSFVSPAFPTLTTTPSALTVTITGKGA